ncbi:NAD(P)-binding protein [Corynespora cassiicola Philippines]|uniref:NAD(P)-binding protein n=1 Tax=Corynespora cassiicola Philippines TaxID=1448308 RepID=A0A2T2P9J3_CORCC|nr:NAD(P)-binding protein [Corynespora cassiicola Philippines]
MESLPVDHFVKTQQFVPIVHRDLYPAIAPDNPSLSQKDKVIIITGASQGLGKRAFAPAFAAAGAKAIVLVARNANQLNDVATEVARNNPEVQVLPMPTDITDPSAVKSLFEKIRSDFGHADILVNNAGLFKAIDVVGNVDEKSWWDEMSINIRGTFLMTQGFLRALPSKETPARIITLTSGAAYEVFPTFSAYGISKLTVFQLMSFVAAEYPNIVAVALHPGTVLTEMTLEPFKRFSLDTPALVGGCGVWLASWEGEGRGFLSGRFVSVNWDVDELLKKKDEIVNGDLLKMKLNAKLGAEQFGQ